MTGRVAQIWRHPIKAHGREACASVTLAEGMTLPWDRTWAVVHDAARLDGAGWSPCRNFMRAAKAPSLMAIEAAFREEEEEVTLTHPDLGQITFRPDEDPPRFLDWIAPILPQDRALPVAVVRCEGRGMTDSPMPSISLNNHASRRALGQKAGRDLSMHRFRGNIWFDGLAPWEEFDWIGRRLRIGGAILSIEDRITRCRATEADPETGRRNVDVLGALERGWGHTDFGVFGLVVAGGEIAIGDPVDVIP